MQRWWCSFIFCPWCASFAASLETDIGRSTGPRAVRQNRYDAVYAIVSSSLSTTPSPSTTNTSHTGAGVGAIAGAVVGSVVGLALVTGAFLCYLRARRRTGLASAGGIIAPQDHTVSPFVVEAVAPTPPPPRKTRRARKGPLEPNRFSERKLQEEQGIELIPTATPSLTQASSSTPAASSDPESLEARPPDERTRRARRERRPRGRSHKPNISQTELRELTSEVHNLREAMEDFQTGRVEVLPGF